MNNKRCAGISFLVIFFLVFGTAFGQKGVEKILEKADSLVQISDFSQSRYYYELAQRYCEKDVSCRVLYEFAIEKKLWNLDSVQAYLFENKEYVMLLRKADSLQYKSPVLAMRTFDEAASLVPALAYPFNKITYIINNTPKIQQQLLVLQAKKQREVYLTKIGEALALEKEGKKVEAYYRYKKIAQEYHDDETALLETSRLEMEIGQEIARFEDYFAQANEYFILEKYTKAKALFQKSLTLNSECKACSHKLENIDYFIYADHSKRKQFEELKQEAKSNYDLGNFERAYYQLVALNKKRPDDAEIDSWLREVDKMIQSELDDKIKTFNAKLLLERANEAYMNQEYNKALQLYTKIEVRYTDVIDYASFVRARIEECIALENINNQE
jgi:hypothetical protein